MEITFVEQNFQNSSLNDFHMLDTFTFNIVVVGLYILIGIVGNSLVISVYLRKMGESTDNRFFIPCLAAGDMLSCTICGISAILMYIFSTEFKNEVACKASWFCMTWSASGAALILVFIAIHRYRKICMPLQHSKLLDKKFQIVACLYISSIIASSPVLFTAGITELNIKPGNLTIHVCQRMSSDIRNDWKLYIALIYTGLEAVIVLSVATLLSTFYIKVGKELVHHFKSMKTWKNTTKINTIHDEAESTQSASDSTSTFQRVGTLKRLTLKRKAFSKKHRYTLIFFAISVICIVTYSPRLLLMILESADPYFWFNFYDKTDILRFLTFLNRLHIVNNIANPFLYAMFDAKFKTHLVQLLKCKVSQ